MSPFGKIEINTPINIIITIIIIIIIIVIIIIIIIIIMYNNYTKPEVDRIKIYRECRLLYNWHLNRSDTHVTLH